jgi:4-amino-4-deoxy-L-arabinose transferase-like glycosyltransferase
LQHGLLLALVLATRLPLLGNFVGEPDSSRYVTGLYLWANGDHANPLVYARSMSAGYYWLGAQLAALTHSPVQSYPLMLNILSLCATLLLVATAYELSRSVIRDGAALLCTALFAISPAIWWMGIEPHPQAVSGALALGALCAFQRGAMARKSTRWLALSTTLLAAALLVKIDAVLFFPAFFGLLLFRVRWDRACISRLLRTAAVLFTALVAFLLIDGAILRGGPLQVQRPTRERLVEFFALPFSVGAVKQAVPVVMAVGPVLFIFAIAGVVLAMRRLRGEQRWRWLILQVAWCLPGWLFWFFISGNNPRHVAISMLGLLWMGVAGWVAACGKRTAIVAGLIAVLLNLVTVPANSSASHLLSPNVPGSVRALRAKEAQINSLAETLAQRGGSACFVGTYTIPYFLQYVVQDNAAAHPALGQDRAQSWIKSPKSPKSPAFSVVAIKVQPERRIVLPCSPAYSVEYGADGIKRRFMGSEVYFSPLWKRLTVGASGSE